MQASYICICICMCIHMHIFVCLCVCSFIPSFFHSLTVFRSFGLCHAYETSHAQIEKSPKEKDITMNKTKWTEPECINTYTVIHVCSIQIGIILIAQLSRRILSGLREQWISPSWNVTKCRWFLSPLWKAGKVDRRVFALLDGSGWNFGHWDISNIHCHSPW